MAVSHPVAHSCSLTKANRQHLCKNTLTFLRSPRVTLLPAGEFWLPSGTVDVHRPSALDRMRFHKGRIHETDNASRYIAADPSAIAKIDQLTINQQSTVRRTSIGVYTCQTEVSTGI